MEVGTEKYILNLGEGERLTVQGDALGRYQVHLKRADGEHELGLCPDMKDAFTRSDRWVKKFRADQMQLLDASAQWREGGPSEKQLKWLTKFGVPITSDLTKGQCSIMLDQLFAANPKKEKPKPQWLQDKIAREKINKKGW
jgi:hypothetical protein